MRFLSEKKLHYKRKNTIIENFLLPIEKRMLFVSNFYTTIVDTDDINDLDEIISKSIKTTNKVEVFNIENIKLILNYGVCLIPIMKLISYVVHPKSGVIFANVKGQDPNDRHNFYLFRKEEDNKRYWELDNRLILLSEKIRTNILPFCINLFKTIYHNVYNDNDYRNDWMEKYPIFEYDCKQLLKNIFLLSKSKEFIKQFQKLIIEHHTYRPKDKDKVGCWSDCILTKKGFSELKDLENSEIVKELFDNGNDIPESERKKF